MSKFSAFLKSPVGKFHTTFAVFILFNLLSGLLNLWVRFMPWLDTVHFYTGLLIVAAPLVYLLIIKNRSIVWKAFVKMALPGKGDRRKPVLPAFKLVTMLMALLILVNAVGGIFMKLRLLPVLSFNVHVLGFKALLALVPLHALLGFWVRGAHAKKPAKVRRASEGNTAQ